MNNYIIIIIYKILNEDLIMKKKITIITIVILFIITAITTLNFTTIDARADTAFSPPPSAPNDNLKWGFDNNTFIGWQCNAYQGDLLILNQPLTYNISKIGLMNVIDTQFPSAFWYLVQLIEIQFNFDKMEFEENLARPIVNCSGVNVTTLDDFVSGSKVGGGLELLCTPFIPLNGSVLPLDWCAQRLINDFGFYISSMTPIVTTNTAADNNLIMLENDATSNEYVRMYFYDNGTLKNGELNTTLGGMVPDFACYNYTRIFDLIPHGAGNYWDFNNDTAIGWKMEGFPGGGLDLVYNISKIGNLGPVMYQMMPNDCYGVFLKQMYWNSTLNQLMEYTNLTANPPSNASAICYEQGYMFPRDLSQQLGMYANPFIPKNSSNVLDLHWCANALSFVYDGYLGGLEEIIVYEGAKTLWFANNTKGTYLNLTYYDNGTLEKAETFMCLGSTDPTSINFTRITDFNPYDDIGEWSVDIGDILYFGLMENETKVEIVEIRNTTILWMGMITMSVQQVLANISTWDFQSESWISEMNNSIIGMASETSPLIMSNESQFFNLLVPKGTTGVEMAEALSWLTLVTSDFDQILYGVNWIKMYNSTTGGYIYFEYFPDGTLKYACAHELNYMGEEELEGMVLYYKNATILAAGFHQINISLVEDLNFTITLNITLDADTLLLNAAFSDNPTGVDLPSTVTSVLFFDIMVNKSSEVDFPINITIQHDINTTETFNILYFDVDSNEWKVLELTDDGMGNLTIQLDHASIFVITLGELPEDDDDDDEPPPDKPEKTLKIPFGNFYLIFMAIGIVALVIKKKRKFRN